MRSNPVYFNILVFATAIVFGAGCGKQVTRNETHEPLVRAEIDCSMFPGAVQRDEYSPPAENEMIDTETAQGLILKPVYPKYPELAMRAGLEGTVFVKVWIGQDGMVKQALIEKSDAEIFNDASLEAARKLLFRPVLCHGIRISVWAVILMKFKLM